MAKLGQLLIERSSVKKKKMSLVEELKAVVWSPEDQKDEYMQSGAKLMQKFFDLSEEEVQLTRRIAEINSSVVVKGTTMTLAQAIARLGGIYDTISLYDALLDRIQGLPVGEDKSETAWVNVISVDTLSSMKENKLKELEELDTAIQNTNWETEVEFEKSSQFSELEKSSQFSEFEKSSQFVAPVQPQAQPQEQPRVKPPSQYMSNQMTPEQAKMAALYQQLDTSGDKGYHEPHLNTPRPQDVVFEAKYPEQQPVMQKKAETVDAAVARFMQMPKITDPACPVCNLAPELRAKVDALYDRTGEIMQVHEFLDKVLKGTGKDITGPQLRRYLDEFHPTRGTPIEQSGPYVPQV